MKTMFMSAILIATFAFQAQAVRFDSRLNGYLNGKDGAVVSITSSPQDSHTWVISVTEPCTKYPCSNEGRTQVIAKVKPKIKEDRRPVDGNLIIVLNSKFTLVKSSGFRQGDKSPYSLKVTEDGATRIIEMHRSDDFSR